MSIVYFMFTAACYINTEEGLATNKQCIPVHPKLHEKACSVVTAVQGMSHTLWDDKVL